MNIYTLKSSLTTVCIVLLLTFTTTAQTRIPEAYGEQPAVGKPMPNFTLQNITHYALHEASLSDFRGKWLIMDFWSLTCTPCINNLPELNRLQNTFKEDIQFLLVGLNSQMMTFGHGKRIQLLYEKLRKNMNLNLASAYDSSSFIRWGIWTIPHVIAIDPNGIVRKISTGGKLMEQDIKEMLLSVATNNQTSQIDPDQEHNTIKLPDIETNKLVYRSILTRSNGEEGKRVILREFTQTPIEKRKDGIIFSMQPLYRLYQSAYFGTWFDWTLIQEMKYPLPILETRDSSLFNFNYNALNFDGLYNYNLVVPPAKSMDLKYIMNTFQNDLKAAFGFDATVEKRLVKVWLLKAKSTAAENLKSRKKTEQKPNKETTPYIDIQLKNITIQELIRTIWGYHQNEIPIVDETGITNNIDITIDGLILDFDQIKRSLEKNGLELIKGGTTMDAIVIRDPVQ